MLPCCQNPPEIPCQQEWREINRNNWGFPWFIEFPQIYYPIAGCSVSTLLWWEWARVWEPRGWGSGTGQPTIATGSWITPRYIAMEMLMGCRGPVVLLLILQSWLCCKNHLFSSQQRKKVDLKSQNAFLSITWPPREILSEFPTWTLCPKECLTGFPDHGISVNVLGELYLFRDTFIAPDCQPLNQSTHTNLSNLTVKTQACSTNQETKSRSSSISSFFQFNALTKDPLILYHYPGHLWGPSNA